MSSSSSLDCLELCRLCLEKERVSVPIFENEGDVRQIFLKITACLPVKVSRDDKLPKKICDDCLYKVELFYQFWNTTANAEKQLLQWLGEVGGLEDGVPEVLVSNVMKQEQASDSRLEGRVVQVGGQNSVDMGMIENMTIITMPVDGEQQFASVPMDTSGTVTVQAVASSSASANDQSQTSVSHLADEVEDDDDDDDDDGCDNEGMPVKEENEEDQSDRVLDQSSFVTIPCDEAGPSGLQQKIADISNMSLQPTEVNDPKTGRSSSSDQKSMSSDSCTRISPKRRKRKRVDSADSQITEEERNEKISSENIKAESSDTSDFEEVTIEGTTSSFTEEVSESSSISCIVPAEDLSIESMNNPAVYMYMCKHCNIYFSQLHLLRHHTESMHPHINAIKSNLEPPFDCKVCNFVTPDRATLTRHITLKHHLSKLLNVKKPSITIQLHPVKSSLSPEHSPPPSPSKPAQNPEKVEGEHVEESMKEEVTSDEVKLETSKTALQEEPKLTQECGDHDYIHIYGLQKSPVPEDYDGEDQSLEQSPSFNQPLITTESEMMVRPSSPVDEILDEDLAQEEIVSTSDIPEESQIEQQLILEVVDMIPQQELEFEIEHQPLVFDQTVAIENSTLVSESNDTLHATELDEDSSLSETVITDSAEEKRDREANQIPPSTRVRNNYICEYCHTVVEGRGAMRFHIRREHNAEWLARKRQELKFKPIYDSEDLTHPCHLCEFKARRRVTLNAHIRRKHPTEKRRRGKPPIKPPVGEEFKCGGCDFTTKHIFKLELHIERKHTLEPTYECEVCGKKYKTKIDLAAHIKFLHMNSASVCDICGKLCRNTNALHVHRKNEHYTPKFKCPHCARRMVTQENLNQHIERQHLNRVKPLCHYCGKSFDQINKLKEHVRSHTGERPFKCKVCGRSFGRAGVYRQHMLTHSGVKPYVCDICGKAFTQKPGLIGHRKSHPGAKDPLPVVFINEIIKKVTQEAPSTSDGPAKEVTLGANNTESSGSDGPSLPNEPSILQDEPVIHIPENPEDGEFNVLSYASDQHDDPLESLQLSEIIEECPEEIINDISL